MMSVRGCEGAQPGAVTYSTSNGGFTVFTYSRVLAGTLAAALTFSAAGAANAETNKEAAHLQMQTLLDANVAG